jgi:hypothetical protein
MLYELAQRLDDGILVRLLWDAGRNQTLIRYRDRKTQDAFSVDVPNDTALDAFHHPNAYRPAVA